MFFHTSHAYEKFLLPSAHNSYKICKKCRWHDISFRRGITRDKTHNLSVSLYVENRIIHLTKRSRNWRVVGVFAFPWWKTNIGVAHNIDYQTYWIAGCIFHQRASSFVILSFYIEHYILYSYFERAWWKIVFDGINHILTRTLIIQNLIHLLQQIQFIMYLHGIYNMLLNTMCFSFYICLRILVQIFFRCIFKNQWRYKNSFILM